MITIKDEKEACMISMKKWDTENVRYGEDMAADLLADDSWTMDADGCWIVNSVRDVLSYASDLRKEYGDMLLTAKFRPDYRGGGLNG